MESAVNNTTTEHAMSKANLTNAKIIAMLVLGASSFLLGILPIKLTKLISIKSMEGNKNLVISLLLCFGGGVLLFTTFIHLQPEVRAGFESLSRNGQLPDLGNGIPLSEIVFCLGFFFVYLVEELAHVFLDKKMHSPALQGSLCPSKKELSIPRVSLAKLDDISYISTSNKELLNSQTTVNFEKHPHHHHHHVDAAMKNSLGGFLVVLALSFHAVFEGLAVGLEGSVEKVWYLFAAIATHKLVIAFCVGVELVTSKTRTLLVFLYIGTFAIVTPLGIGAGLLLSEKGSAEDVTSLVLQGMAAGTLLYVVFFEVLARERSNSHSGFWQLAAILSGFLCMFLLQVLVGHDHNHGADHHIHQHGRHHAEAVEDYYGLRRDVNFS